jgi:hypothetical protein
MMIHYKDMTFCRYHKNCAGSKDCGRALTDEVLKDAKKWVNSWTKDPEMIDNPPLCLFSQQPECYVDQNFTPIESRK